MSQSKFEKARDFIRVYGIHKQEVERLTEEILGFFSHAASSHAGASLANLGTTTVFVLTSSEKKDETTSILSGRRALDTLLILNLEDLGLVRLADDTHLPIRWFASCDPRALAGSLLDHYQGTYFSSPEETIVYQSNFERDFFIVPSSIEKNARARQQWLAAICAARSIGVDTATVQAVLHQS